MTSTRPAHRTAMQIFLWPMVIGVLSVIGLLAGLIGDGPWDTVSWASLAVPILLFAALWSSGRLHRAR